MEPIDYLISFGSVSFFAFVCSMLYDIDFSMNVFMGTFAIGVLVMIWCETLPDYMAVISVLLLVGMLFNSPSGEMT